MADGEMTDREVIEICAEICGKCLGYSTGGKACIQCGKFYVGVNWNPLTDANDERMVLEAMRKRCNETDVHKSGWMKMIINLADYADSKMDAGQGTLADFILGVSEVGDIAQAAAKAFREV